MNSYGNINFRCFLGTDWTYTTEYNNSGSYRQSTIKLLESDNIFKLALCICHSGNGNPSKDFGVQSSSSSVDTRDYWYFNYNYSIDTRNDMYQSKIVELNKHRIPTLIENELSSAKNQLQKLISY